MKTSPKEVTIMDSVEKIRSRNEIKLGKLADHSKVILELINKETDSQLKLIEAILLYLTVNVLGNTVDRLAILGVLQDVLNGQKKIKRTNGGINRDLDLITDLVNRISEDDELPKKDIKRIEETLNEVVAGVKKLSKTK